MNLHRASPPREARHVERQEAVMAQPAQIGVEEGAQIGDAVFQHRDALDPHAEGEALVLGGIDAAILPAPWDAPCRSRGFRASRRRRRSSVRRPCASSRYRPRPRLGEREIARAEAHRQIVDLEEGAAELDQAALQMAHMGRAVDRPAPRPGGTSASGSRRGRSGRCGPAR